MPRKETQNTVRDILEKFRHFDSDDTGSYEKGLDQALSQLYQELKKCVPSLETRFLSKNNLQWELGWCKGRNDAIDTMHKNLKKACGVE